MTPPPIGFVGLGNMGRVLAANLVASGHAVLAHDAAGAARVPEGADVASDVAAVARRAEVVVLSLPDGAASAQVAGALAAVADRRATHVVDTSTIGPDAARGVAATLAEFARTIPAEWATPVSRTSTRPCPAASPAPGRARSS